MQKENVSEIMQPFAIEQSKCCESIDQKGMTKQLPFLVIPTLFYDNYKLVHLIGVKPHEYT